MQLTDKQLEAVHETKRNLQIIACAGSGKTDYQPQDRGNTEKRAAD